MGRRGASETTSRSPAPPRTPSAEISWPRLLGLGAVAAGMVIGLSFSCTGSRSAPPRQPAAARSTSTVSAAKQDEGTFVSLTSYAEAIRRRNFERAATLIDALGEGERKQPEVRYARALTALELGDVETALRSVNRLEDVAPAFAAEARAVRIRAARQSLDVSLLSAFLGDSLDAEESLTLARAHLSSASPLEARKRVDEALDRLERQRKSQLELEAQAHVLRAGCFEAEGKPKEAAREFRWLAIHAARVPPESLGLNESFESRMRALDETLTIPRQDRIARARIFSEAGRIEETTQEVDAISALAPFPEGIGLIAWSVYVSRTDYERASQLFALAAKTEASNRKRHLYYEAKALARSHRDADAIDKYEQVAQLGGEYAQHAAFQAARLRFIDGQWAESVRAFDDYLGTYGSRSSHASDARYSRAVARLAAGQNGAAVRELSQLAQSADGSRERARLLQLKAVGLWADGQRAEAIQLFRDVIELRPLSLAALLAEARLRSVGESIPPRLLPDKSTESLPPAIELTLPDKAARLNRVGLDEEAEAALLAEENALRNRYGERRHEALCRLYGQLQSARRRYQIAQYAATWKHLSLEPTPATRWEWECIYPEPYRQLVDAEAERRRVPRELVYGVMRQESAFRPTVVSPADAVGLMQIIPSTASRIADELGETYEADHMRSPATNVRYGTYYLRRLLDMFGGRPELAAAAYNAGPHAVTRWLRAGENLPLDLFVARIPYRETRGYVYRVMGNLARYTYLDNPDSVVTFELELPKGLSAPPDAY